MKLKKLWFVHFLVMVLWYAETNRMSLGYCIIFWIENQGLFENLRAVRLSCKGETMDKKGKWLILILAILVLIWTAIIFAQSAKNGERSTDDTNKIVAIIENVAEIFGVDFDVPTKLLRKCAHFGEYAVLGALAVSAVLAARKPIFCGCSFLYAVAVAVCDEFVVQRMTEGRGPQFADVLIDAGGALFGILIVFGISCLVKLVKTKTKNKTHKNKC